MACRTLLPLLISSILVLAHLHSSAAQTVVKGGYWFPDSGLAASAIDSTLFTHLFCAFADLDPTSYRVTISSQNAAPFSTFTQTVQQKNPSVKTLLSIGGGGSSASSFSSMASQPTTRKAFIDSSISLARSNGFHGLDLDWEYPSNPTDMTNLGSLLNEWRAAVVSEASQSGKAQLLLAAAVFYSSNYYSVLYPVQAIANSLNWINVMAYDFYGPGWSPTVTGPPAALYNPGNTVSGDNGIRAWIQAGLPAKKIALGVPFYGYAWRLTNSNNNGQFAPASGAAYAGDSALSYQQIRNFITQNSAQTVYNASVVGNYCFSGTTWIGYDDTQAISAKVSYAKGKGLLGYFAWQVAADSNFALARQASTTWGA